MRTVLVIMWVMWAAYAQDCKTGGKRCADHGQCCGGCCFGGECIDTYESCFSISDVCADHSCIGDENCISFIPPECPGCEPVPICRLELD